MKHDIKTWQWGTVLPELKREVWRKAGVDGESLSQRESLRNDVGRCGDAS